MAKHDSEWIAACREELYRLLQNPECQRLRFDITGMPVMPSEMLGLMVSVMKRGCKVEIIHPTPDVRDVFRLTKLDTILTIFD